MLLEKSVKGLKLESVSKVEVTNDIVSDNCIINVVDKEEDNKNPFTWDIDKYDLGPNRLRDTPILICSKFRQSMKQ